MLLQAELEGAVSRYELISFIPHSCHLTHTHTHIHRGFFLNSHPFSNRTARGAKQQTDRSSERPAPHQGKAVVNTRSCKMGTLRAQSYIPGHAPVSKNQNRFQALYLSGFCSSALHAAAMANLWVGGTFRETVKDFLQGSVL